MQAGNILAGHSRLVANCLGYSSNATDTTVAENLANARLIAQAPSLLEAAKAALPWLEYIDTKGDFHVANELNALHTQLRAAIAAAEGVES